MFGVRARLRQHERRISALEVRVMGGVPGLAKLDERINGLSLQARCFSSETRDRSATMDKRLDLMDERLRRMDDRLDDVDGRLDRVDKRLSGLDQRLDARFGELRHDLGDIKAMLVGLGAVAPGDRVN